MRSSVLSSFGSSMLKPLPFSTMAGKTGKAGAVVAKKKNTSTAADQAPNGVGDFKKLYSQCVGPTSSCLPYGDAGGRRSDLILDCSNCL